VCYARSMSDQPKDAAESPMQRALRMKKAALESKPKGPGAADLRREKSAGVAPGASKPWMKK
jgi:hypothetical protein